MALVDMKDMLHHAYEHDYAVGAFDPVSLDFLTGIMAAAERAHAPVILSLAAPRIAHLDFETIMAAAETAARRAAVPVAIHLDQGTNVESAVRAIRCGCNSVMIDASHQELPENIAQTKTVVDMAHACGVPVEGRLGHTAGIEDKDAKRHPDKTAPAPVSDAKAYVQRTGVDFLAVSVDPAHGRMKGESKRDRPRLKQINQALGIPLAIRGDTEFSDDQRQTLIADGVAKVNHDTALTDAIHACMGNHAKADRSNGYTDLMQSIQEIVAAEVERRLRLWGAAGRAAEVLAQCRPWTPVEHLIIYNVTNASENEVRAIMAEGRRVLGAIPGVREVFTGEAVKHDAKYRYTWLVRFCHPAVITSYRDHPDHVAFADNLFRPVAGERISIDYQAVETASLIKNAHDARHGEKR